ncbi:MAG: histone H1 [Bacteroidia bacterium]|nr:histone H1 [Bacteroidia bacterium]MDW8235304.1 histone H1 [Bacteroidia bacterium]
MKRYDELNQLVGELTTDLRKFYDDGNKAAGTRARKALLTLKNWAHQVRREISDMKAKTEKEAPKKSDKPAPKAPPKKAPPKKK